MSSLKYKTESYILLKIVLGNISAAKTPSKTNIFAQRKLIRFSEDMWTIRSKCRQLIHPLITLSRKVVHLTSRCTHTSRL
jgi:hypothetical protein